MKSRTSFVSNSSSCSFIISTICHSPKEFKKTMRRNKSFDNFDDYKDITIEKMWEQVYNYGVHLNGVISLGGQASNDSGDRLSAAIYAGCFSSIDEKKTILKTLRN